jgi:hypothetical protein
MAIPHYVSDTESPILDSADQTSQYQYDDPSYHHTAGAPYYEERLPYYPPCHDYTPTAPPPGYADANCMQTRSGRSLVSPSSPKRGQGQPPVKRAPKKRAGKAKATTHALNGPLSELTKDYSIPVKDMEAWVNRSSEERRREADKKNGYISRPMNSFMLYRSAYAERVKQFCKENNHQIVSQVTGASWPLEPQTIRGHYESLAIQERDNHQRAFPDYKFAPNKGKKRGRDDDDDSDGEWGGSSRTKRSRTGHSTRDNTPMSRHDSPFDDFYAPSPAQHQVEYNPSAWGYGYPMPPPPAMYYGGMPPYHGGHYQPTMIQQYAPNVEDLSFAAIDPFPQAEPMVNNLAALPSSKVEHLLDPADNTIGQVTSVDAVDPRLQDQYALPELNDFDRELDGHRQSGYAEPPFHPGQSTLTDSHDPFDEARGGTEFGQ